ncbi:PrsW family glutamic-type intramembrane protease [Actinacidiphila yeochonensis]|uniref:PrsW family glutamic-type intramembrane protease n=1 Tax=Actinacidiphila yeochonensis TaxID=89050 RepID=UPI0007C6BF03|nr:PrsW family glutamic-type intramembrane protease [Actinacidiphila yeochonensis]
MTSYTYPPAPDGPGGGPDAGPGPAPAAVHYRPRRPFWESRAVRTGGLFTALAVCGVVILAVVRHHIGTEPFVVGLALAVVPVPLILWGYLWFDHVAPSPWQNVAFAFSWGACAATLVAIFANEYGAKLLASTLSATPTQSDHWGAMFVAPLVEESAKGTALLLLFLARRRYFESLLDGIVLAGLTATGFAFTENILYLGSAFNEDKAVGGDGVGTTAATFIVRVVMTPFAHPLFTSMTGLGFALAATVRPGRRWRWRWAPPVGGWMLAMVLHGTWNGTSELSPLSFLTVYVAVMVPVFGLVLSLAFWSRSRGLRTVRRVLPAYAAAGWLPPDQPAVLGSMRVRAEARREARRLQGEEAGRAVRDYVQFATHLAFLRDAAERGAPTADFAAREAELLAHLWHRKTWAGPALAYAARLTGDRPLWPTQLPGPHGSWAPYPSYPPGPQQGFPAPYALHPAPYAGYAAQGPAPYPPPRQAAPQWPQWPAQPPSIPPQPVASEPIPPQPVAPEPGPSQPAASEPGPSQPVPSQPVPSQSAAPKDPYQPPPWPAPPRDS